MERFSAIAYGHILFTAAPPNDSGDLMEYSVPVYGSTWEEVLADIVTAETPYVPQALEIHLWRTPVRHAFDAWQQAQFEAERAYREMTEEAEILD